MYGNPQRRRTEEVARLRREGGRWLKSLREQQGLSQSQLAARLGSDGYTFISQLETGRGRIPPDRYVDWSKALEMQPAEFARELMRYYDPVLHRLLFDDAPPTRRTPAFAQAR